MPRSISGDGLRPVKLTRMHARYEDYLWAMCNKLYQIEIRGGVSGNNMAHTNEVRDWCIWADFARILIHTAPQLYADDSLGIELDQAV